MLLFLVWVALCITVGMFARLRRNRSAFGWTFGVVGTSAIMAFLGSPFPFGPMIAILVPPFALIFLAILPVAAGQITPPRPVLQNNLQTGAAIAPMPGWINALAAVFGLLAFAVMLLVGLR